MMNTLGKFFFVLLVTAAVNGYCEVSPESPKPYGAGGGVQGGGRPTQARIAEWRARRAAREAGATEAMPAPTFGSQRRGAPEGAAGNGPSSSTGKPAEGIRGGGSPGGGQGGGRGGGTLWLSDSPPSRGDGARGGGRPGGMGGMEMGGERGGVPKKRFWLRTGTDPLRSGFAQEDVDALSSIVLVSPAGKPDGTVLPPAKDERTGLVFETPIQGFYRLYLTNRTLHGDILSVAVAKAEVANFSHGGDEEETKKTITASRYLDTAPLEIVRERKEDEKRFFQLKSGDSQAFIVLRKGLPLQGARVRFVSHQGWSKEAVSDEQGRVTFQVIRDYFPAWEKFQKRFKATYLVLAEFSAPETGIHKDQPYTQVRYQTSLAGSYYPSPDDYRSYAWGLGVGLLITLFCGVAVYLYRQRRVKPFQEVRFSENG